MKRKGVSPPGKVAIDDVMRAALQIKAKPPKAGIKKRRKPKRRKG